MSGISKPVSLTIDGTLNSTGTNTTSTQIVSTATTNQIKLTPGAHSYIINAASPGADRTVSINPDPLTNCNFMLDNTGGAVTQATSNVTAVTLNARAGLITLHAATANNATNTFVFNNSYIQVGSQVLVFISNTLSLTNFITPSVTTDTVAAGSCNINVINNDPTHALAAAAIVQFIVV